jgi:hypothetical protein
VATVEARIESAALSVATVEARIESGLGQPVLIENVKQ